MARGEEKIGARGFTNPLEGQSRGTPASFHPRAISTPAAAPRRTRLLPAPNLVSPQR